MEHFSLYTGNRGSSIFLVLLQTPFPSSFFAPTPTSDLIEMLVLEALEMGEGEAGGVLSWDWMVRLC